MKLADDKLAAIKTATHAAIAQLGGLLAAATVCNKSVAVLSEYQSRAHPDRIIPTDTAMLLDMALGQPVIIGALLRLQGYAIARSDGDAVPAIGHAVGHVAQQAGALASMLLAAQADGALDDGERADLRRIAEAVRDGADATLAGLAAPALRVVA